MAKDRKATLRILIAFVIFVTEQLLTQLLKRSVVPLHHNYISLLRDSIID